MIPTSVIEELLSYSEDSRIALDSRKVSAGDVFVAIKGDIADGNDFVEDALSAGATRVFSNRPCADPRVITVHDTVELLMEAAKEVMSRSHLKSRIAITGSNGKTTTKEITAFLLSQLGKTFKTAGNLNTEIGLPLSLLENRRELLSAKYGVFELGTNAKGDIRRLVDLVEPNLCVLLNVGTAHVGNFGGIDELLEEKLSIFESGKLSRAVLGGTDERLRKFAADMPVETRLFGRNDADFSIVDFSYDSGETLLHFDCEGDRFVRLKGIWSLGQLMDLGAAYLVANFEGLEEPSIFLSDYKSPFRDRFSVEHLHGITLISDFYNSSLESWESAIVSIEKLSHSRKIAVAGSILEQGEEEANTHEKLGRLLGKFDITILFNHDKAIEAASKYVEPSLITDSVEQLAEWLFENVRKGDLVFLKASRAVALERVHKAFVEMMRNV